MFARIGLKNRLIMIGVVSLLGMLAIGILSAFHQRTKTYEERMSMLKSVVESAKTQALYYENLQKTGKLSEQDAKNQAREALRAMRFQGDNYVFMYTYDGITILLPPTPEKEGTSRIEFKDPNGVPLIRNLIEAGKTGGAFTTYNYPRPGEKEAAPKVGYASNIPGWGWAIGAGLYVDDIQAAFYADLWISGVTVLIVALIVFGVVTLVTRSVMQQIGGEPVQAMQAMKVVAEGDLTVEVHTKYSESMLGELNILIRALRKLVGDIHAGAEHIGSASSHILQSASEVALTAGNQASATQSMAAAMEELTVSITQISDNASETERHAAAAEVGATQGEEQVNTTVDSMKQLSSVLADAAARITGLNKRTQEVGSIAAVIKDIADQTNLLALNAAIEAARAGETGRGFAVVADEVRKLAERTTTATGEISNTLSAIQQEAINAVHAMENAGSQAELSVEQVVLSSGVLRNLADGASQAKLLIGDVAAAAREQRAASNALAQQVEQIAHAAEETSHNMNQTSQSAKELERVSGALHDSVKRFRC